MSEQIVPAADKKKKGASKKDKTMPLTEHLREIRNRLIYVAAAYIILVIGCFIFIERLVSIMLAMTSGFEYVYLSPSELIMCYMRLSLIFALVAVSPLIAYHLWAFAVPALEKREKIVCLLCLLAGFLFFILGIIFSFKIVLPFTLTFLANYNTMDIISASISVDSYTRFVLNILLIFGLVFEMPVVTCLLSFLGILTPKFLIKVRKYAILVIFIMAAVITPPDVVSQIMVAAPMLLLYQVSIYISRVIAWRKAKKEKEDEED